MPANCTPTLWTSGRYSETVINSMADALAKQLDANPSIREIVLIGYSGGGNLAVLLAPRLAGSVPVSVVTIAANLDTVAWSAHHRVLPLQDSLNPAEQQASGLQEMHFQGAEDTVVPPATSAAYFQRHPQARSVTVEAFDHRCCWAQQWPQLLQQALQGAS
ncbi:lipase family protein [Parahaliea maris]|uniref:Lipase family protein n=2 Tax=Parahaliea maris TaxID=2716870 RepID=A0A5C9AAQ3_9GAMM|nr:lipase family protein [Parahaliea maris]